MEIGDRIRLAREHKRLEILDLAKALKVSYETVRSWEAGKHQPRPQKYRRISEITGVRYAWLVSGEDPMLASGRTTREARADVHVIQTDDGLPPALQKALHALVIEIQRAVKRA